MAGRVIFAIFFMIALPSYAPTIGAEKDCPLGTMAENPPEAGRRYPSNNLKDEVPYPISEVKGAFPPDRVTDMRKVLKRMELDLEPGREYLNDAKNAVSAFDQWKQDYDTALKNPAMKVEAEKLLLTYLQNPPAQVDGEYHYHPGLSPERTLDRKRSLDDYFKDEESIRMMATIARTLENTLEFRSVLEADTFQDPARRSRYITQMRAAYFMVALLRNRLPARRDEVFLVP